MANYKDFLTAGGEKKWQDEWEKSAIDLAEDFGAKPKKYVLDMFPYPSGAGLHVGHPEGYTATDIYSRYFRFKGFNVLHPIGWDAFGLPAENYAIKTGTQPAVTTQNNITTFRRQIKSLGFSYDWSREVDTTDPKYYKWTQWIFLQLFKKELAYEAVVPINWCPSCKTGLSNEEVKDGKCDRCGTPVEKKNMRQWMLKITAYADRLLEGLDKLDWPESIKTQQRNWIGRSEGAEVEFKISSSASANHPGLLATPPWKGGDITVYTTRPDTLFGATYMVLSPEHKLVQELKDKIENFSEVEKYLEGAKNKSDLERTELNKGKTGVELVGIKAINPVNNQEIPVWISDYVLASYGTGAIMAVPAHDERDWAFAKKFDLPIIDVIRPVNGESHENEESRRTISSVIYDKKNDKFLMIKWKKFDWISLVIGGIDGDETPEQAAEREVFEETGYRAKAIEKLGGEVESHFFAENKNVWRERFDQPVLLELVSDQREKLVEEEEEKHEIIWLDRHEAISKMTHPYNAVGIERFLKKNYAFTDIDSGKMINSDFLDGLKPSEAIGKMADWLEENDLGKKAVNYKLRDWVFSRQRYWGEPIPLVHCDKCGVVALDEKDLPLTLPEVEKYEPTGTGESPLTGITEWVNTACPKCGGPAKRETNTMPQWAGSSWYWLRYLDPKNDKSFADKKKLDYWLPVDLYLGGAEHAVLHLLYARFWNMVLFDLGYVPQAEPFTKLVNQGLILGEDGEKMSKSRGNVVNPDDGIKEFGADAFRMYEMFMGPLEDVKPWSTRNVIGISRFLEKVWQQFEKRDKKADNSELEIMLHKTIKKVGEDIENLRLNTAIAAMMILMNKVAEVKSANDDFWQKFLIVLAPFAPHITEELWHELGNKNSIFKESWPAYDSDLIKEDMAEYSVQINGKIRAKLSLPVDASEEEAVKAAKADENVIKHLAGQETKKIIFVKGKMISLVI